MTAEAPPRGKIAVKVDQFLTSDETTADLTRDVLWRVCDIVSHINGVARRTAVVMMSLMVVFELLNRRLVNEASFGGIRLAQLDFLRALIPLAVAYLLLQMAVLGRDTAVYLAIMHRITECRFPGLYDSDLDRLIPRISGPVVSPLPASYTLGLPRLARAALILQLAANVVPLAFFVYAFWQLFATNGVADALVWASMLGTLLLVCFVAGFVVATLMYIERRDRQEFSWVFLGIRSRQR
jgi:hypothetical protein